MDVGSAVRKAKEYIAETLADEGIIHVGLEEVDFDHVAKEWKVTIGFFRRWQTEGASFGELLTGKSATSWNQRYFKLITIDDLSGEVLSMKIRRVPSVHA